MNEQDAKILEMYLRDTRKKKIFFLILIILFIAVFLLYGYYTKYKKPINEIDNSIQEEIQNNNIINEIDSKEENTSTTENITAQENTEKQLNEVQETQIEEKQETKEKTTDNTKTTVISENKEKKASEKPANKDFLFTDGYTMDNVTQAAQDYLQSFSYSGECIPIKDKEGVYLGMRVTFY